MTIQTPRYPIGTPEYDAYATELRAELAKFAAHEPPYAGPLGPAPACDSCRKREAGHGHFGLYCQPCSELPYGVSAP